MLNDMMAVGKHKDCVHATTATTWQSRQPDKCGDSGYIIPNYFRGGLGLPLGCSAGYPARRTRPSGKSTDERSLFATSVA